MPAPRSSSWKRTRPMDSTRHLRDSRTWKRCRKWARYPVLAAISMMNKIRRQYALQPKRQRPEPHPPWSSRAWIQSHLPVEAHSLDNNPVVWAPAPRLQLPQSPLPEQRARHWGSRTSRQSAAQCSRIRLAVRTLDITCPKTPTIQLFWRTWAQAPISSPSRHFSKEASMQACHQANSIDEADLTIRILQIILIITV